MTDSSDSAAGRQKKSSPALLNVSACEHELDLQGTSRGGAGYARSANEALPLHRTMLEVVREKEGRVSVLDVGCGLGHLIDALECAPSTLEFDYLGTDLSQRFLSTARELHPRYTFRHLDILNDAHELGTFDYVIMNGLFNYKGDLPFSEMWDYFCRMVSTSFSLCRKGVAFNAMSKHVDWERGDLFHLPLDDLARFLVQSLTRHFVVRHDYPAYEFTTYVYRAPAGAAGGPLTSVPAR